MVMGERPRVSIFFSLILFSSSLNVAKADLSDFGGDVRQYMSLLQGTSAFSFSPDKGIELFDITDCIHYNLYYQEKTGSRGRMALPVLEWAISEAIMATI